MKPEVVIVGCQRKYGCFGSGGSSTKETCLCWIRGPLEWGKHDVFDICKEMVCGKKDGEDISPCWLG